MIFQKLKQLLLVGKRLFLNFFDKKKKENFIMLQFQGYLFIAGCNNVQNYNL